MKLQGRRVLVVEEDDATWDHACEALQATGAKIIRARASGEALMTLVGAEPDVVLVDVDLHGTPALELLHRLREMETSKGGRVPAATVGRLPLSEDETRLYREAGAQAHLTKPVDGDQLLATVTSLAGQQVERRVRRGTRVPELRSTGT